MDAFVSLSILIGSIFLPPLVDTILIRFKRPWIGPLLGSLSVFLLWPLIYLLPPPPPLFDPYGKSQLLGLDRPWHFTLHCHLIPSLFLGFDSHRFYCIQDDSPALPLQDVLFQTLGNTWIGHTLHRGPDCS